MYPPVLRSAACLLVHTPHLVRHGSKPSRTLPPPPCSPPAAYTAALRDYPAAVGYPPNQVFIGNLPPDALYETPQPWWRHPLEGAQPEGPFGPILPEPLFLGWLKAADPFDLVLLEEQFTASLAPQLAAHPLGGAADAARLGPGVPLATLTARVAAGQALPLMLDERLVGAVLPGHAHDAALAPSVLLENLAAKASAALALRRALAPFAPDAPPLDALTHILSASEEAVGDRYNRGGGNLAKAIGELAGCTNASGCDIKAFCAGPLHALIIAGSLVATGVAESVAVVGGGSLAKLGMKYESHLAKGLPILEDCLGAVAAVVGRDDGHSPRLRLDVVGRHPIGAGSAQQAILEALVVAPLARAGRRLTEVDKYATELQNPEITAPADRADVARQNYRLLAALAARRGEIAPDALDAFVRAHGLPGYAPTQGHIPSAIPFLPWARAAMQAGTLRTAMFLAKGSLFLGRMTTLADGASLLLEAPG
ncbi:MAG TPA: glycine/sarcosine/betaine reductase complex component C subunit beta [Chloroflexota bacterium]|nr:glycine/sarcosine/betaine reductase complex component C subunit beta [Chloroflexota bacterium]